MVSEDATEERTDDTGDSVAGAEESSERGRHLGRGREGDDGVSPRGDTSTTCTSDGAADDQRGAIGCDTTDQGAELEDGDGDEEGDFEGEVFVDFAPRMG